MAKFLFQPCEMCGCLAVSFQDFSRVSEQLGSAEPNGGFTTNLVRTFGVLCVWEGKDRISRIALLLQISFAFCFYFFPPEISRT